MDKPFYINNHDKGYAAFATASEAVAAAAGECSVYIEATLWTLDRLAELQRAEKAVA